MLPSELYQGYLTYLNDVRQANSIDARSKSSAEISEQEFVEQWNSKPPEEQDYWRQRFTLGYAEVQKKESDKLAIALFDPNTRVRKVA